MGVLLASLSKPSKKGSTSCWFPFKTIPEIHGHVGQIPVPPVNIPIPTKIGSKMGGEFIEKPPKWDPKTVLKTATSPSFGRPSRALDVVIAGVQQPRRGEALVVHRAGLRAGHGVHFVDEGPRTGPTPGKLRGKPMGNPRELC